MIIDKQIKIFLVSHYLFAIPAIKIAIEKNNGELVGTQSELNSTSIERNLKKTQANILILILDHEVASHDDQLIKQIKEAYINIKIIMVVKNAKDMQKLIKSPASGFLLVNENFDELIRAIKNVNLGQNYYSPKVATIIAQEIKSSHIQLSPRETEVFTLLSSEKSRSQVTDELEISRSTLRSHIRNIRTKLGQDAI